MATRIYSRKRHGYDGKACVGDDNLLSIIPDRSAGLFLKTLYRTIAKRGEYGVTILAADHANTRRGYDRSSRKSGVKVVRYRYFIKKYQNLLYEDAALSNIHNHPLSMLLVFPLILSLIWAAHRHLRSAKFDLIHAHWALPAGLIAVVIGKIHGMPVIVTSHGGDVYGLKSPILKFLMKIVFSKAQLVNAVSHPVRTEILNLSSAANVKVKSMGVDDTLFKPIPNARSILGLPAHKPIILLCRQIF